MDLSLDENETITESDLSSKLRQSGDFNADLVTKLFEGSSVDLHCERDNFPPAGSSYEKKNLGTDMVIGTYTQGSIDSSRWRLTSEVRVTPMYEKHLKSDHILWVQVNHWDSVFGPIVEQVWCTSQKEKDDDVFEYIARQTLQASCTSNLEGIPKTINTEVHICPEFDVSVVSATLHVEKSNARYSLSVVIAHEETDRFLTTIDAIQDEMSILGHEVQVIFDCQRSSRPERQDKVGRRWKLLNSLLQQFASRFDMLFEKRIDGRVELQNTWFFFELNEEQLTRLSMVITSHLQMTGRTVIIGPDIGEINLYINTLCLFSDEGQRALSRTAVFASTGNLVDWYFRQLYIQGIMVTESNYDATAVKKLQEAFLLAPGPTSLVNLFNLKNSSEQIVKSARTRSVTNKVPSSESSSSKDRGELVRSPICSGLIKQTAVRNEYGRFKLLRKRSARYRTTHVRPSAANRSRTNSSSLPDSRSNERKKHMKFPKPKEFDQDSSYINKLVKDALALPTPLVLTYIFSQYRLLQHRAAELLAYVEEEKGELLAWNDRTAHCSEKDFPSGKGIPRNLMYPDLLKQFREQVTTDLKISNSEDFCVFLSIAERYRPNLHLTLYGNPIFRKRMNDLLSLFM